MTGDFVVNSSVIEKISIPKVEFIGEDMYITSDALLDLDANAVESVGASLIVKGSVAQKNQRQPKPLFSQRSNGSGNELTVQYFPKLQGIYLPALESVAGTASFSDMSSIGSLAMTELHSVGGLTIKNCKEISIVELPVLFPAERPVWMRIKSISLIYLLLKDVLGDMTLSNLLIEELDLSQINFNGNTLTLQCKQLNKIVGSGNI